MRRDVELLCLGALLLSVAGCACEGEAGPKGATGKAGDSGPPGATGPEGPAGDAGPQGPAGEAGPEGPAGEAGPPGEGGVDPDAGVTSLSIKVIDRETRAPLDKAEVSLDPNAGSGTTDKYGEVTLAVPPGVYKVWATAAGVSISGDTVAFDTQLVDSPQETAVVKSGETTPVKVRVLRWDPGAINLYAIHKAGAPIYKTANCKVCHSDMLGFKTTSTATPPLLPFHGLKKHSELDCLTGCHSAVEVNPGGWGNSSGASLRKQVDVAKCSVCHNYPTTFP